MADPLTVTRAPCPRCGADPGSTLACLACGAVLDEPAGSTHFARLGLEPAADVDLEQLESRYLALSRRLHPDFQRGAEPAEAERALRNSALLNGARAVLADETRRAEYLLGLLDADALERTKTLSPMFLAESLELSEEVETARAARDEVALQRVVAVCREELEARRARVAAALAAEPVDTDAVAVALHEARVYRRILRDAS